MSKGRFDGGRALTAQEGIDAKGFNRRKFSGLENYRIVQEPSKAMPK